MELEQKGWNAERLSGRDQKCARLIVPDGFEGVRSRYEALLRVTDFVSGMTDRYALDLYRKLKGISV
jgi:dGTPase